MEFLTQYPTELFILIFLIITFLQSGLDKLLDWKGNIHFIKEHFQNSPLKNSVPTLLGIVLFLEIVASIFMIAGFYQLAFQGIKGMALLGVELCAITLICLLIGQRLAKDYAGAMSLTVYFLCCIFGMYLLSK